MEKSQKKKWRLQKMAEYQPKKFNNQPTLIHFIFTLFHFLKSLRIESFYDQSFFKIASLNHELKSFFFSKKK